jgi:hypothetical protein
VLVVLYRVVALSGKDEISGNELGPLMKQLVEGVLSVRSWLTKQDRTSGVLDILATAGDCLSVGLHGQLLEVCRKPVEILIKTTRG